MSIYQFLVRTIQGKEISLSEFKGKVLLIVNTASNCGFTPQYQELQSLYDTYKDRGFVVLGFPCNQFLNQEPGTEKEIEQSCQINYGVSFPLFSKVEVRGKNAHPLFTYLTQTKKGIITSEIKWNFTKFLVDKNGHVVNRFAPTTSPLSFEKEIVHLLEN